MGYSPWGGKESDMAECLSTHTLGVNGDTLSTFCVVHEFFLFYNLLI